MSQSKRSHVLARVRWRKQAARLVARVCFEVHLQRHLAGWRAECALGESRYVVATSGDRETAVRDAWGGVVRRISEGQVTFDVALVRAHCERLLADAGRRSTDRVVFTDWTRDRGLGPENRERGAFVRCSTCGGTRVLANLDGVSGLVPVGPWTGPMVEPMERWKPGVPTVAVDVGEAVRCPDCLFGLHQGGWPGHLARSYGWERCSTCVGRGRIECHPAPGFRLTFQGKPTMARCPACNGRGRVRKPGVSPGVAAGPGLARTAQRLLDALDGRCPWAPGAGAQSSECSTCAGSGDDFPMYWDGHEDTTCSDCRGTGHNLAGVLPEVERTPAMRGRAVRALDGDGRTTLDR